MVHRGRSVSTEAAATEGRAESVRDGGVGVPVEAARRGGRAAQLAFDLAATALMLMGLMGLYVMVAG